MLCFTFFFYTSLFSFFKQRSARWLPTVGRFLYQIIGYMDALPKTHLDLHVAITLMDEEQNKMLRNIQRGHLS